MAITSFSLVFMNTFKKHKLHSTWDDGQERRWWKRPGRHPPMTLLLIPPWHNGKGFRLQSARSRVQYPSGVLQDCCLLAGCMIPTQVEWFPHKLYESCHPRVIRWPNRKINFQSMPTLFFFCHRAFIFSFLLRGKKERASKWWHAAVTNGLSLVVLPYLVLPPSGNCVTLNANIRLRDSAFTHG